MRLSQILQSRFMPDVRARGVAYARNGSTRIKFGDRSVVRAEVQGVDRYRVDLELDGRTLYVTCSCPYFEGREIGCKHCWATVLVAEQKGFLRDVLRTRGIKVKAILPGMEHGVVKDDHDLETGPPPKVQPAAQRPFPQRPGPQRPMPQRPGALKPGAPKPGTPKPGMQKHGLQPKPGTPQPATPQPGTPQPNGPGKRKRGKGAPPTWKRAFDEVKQQVQRDATPTRHNQWPNTRQLLYIIDAPGSKTGRGVCVEIAYQERKKDGDWTKPKFQSVSRNDAHHVRDPADADILTKLYGADPANSYGYDGFNYGSARFMVVDAQLASLLPVIGRTNRLHVRLGASKESIQRVRWDDGPPWKFVLRVEHDESRKKLHVNGVFTRGAESLALSHAQLLVPGGLIVWEDRAALLDDGGGFPWINTLLQNGPFIVNSKQGEGFLRDLLLLPQLPPVELPEELRWNEEKPTPKPRLLVLQKEERIGVRPHLDAKLSYDYAGVVVEHGHAGRGVYVPEGRRLILRDSDAEAAAVALLVELGFRAVPPLTGTNEIFELAPTKLPKATLALIQAGWHVEAEGKRYRSASDFKIDVTSELDWFDLKGVAYFGDQTIALPRLLQALKRGDESIVLDDGSIGMLPDDWLKKYGMLAGLGATEGDNLRFGRAQVGLLDALLESQPDVSFDESYRKASEELHRFEGIEPVEPPPEFVGELRTYQKEGLGWLNFLVRFGFGGCLADDMGLGKTVQVLALLAGRRHAQEADASAAPSLIVLPKSLVFNWKQEAARFAPQLRVLDHTGATRIKSTEHFDEFDVILTTYGTLRRDVLMLKDFTFDHCILDEAQAVKNADSEQAKAVRLLRANHRLAMSGTPVENHLGELWSLFEFLNPGMLGRASLFKLVGGAARNPDPETRQILAQGLRPYILRRTKEQVAKDLPEKTEQTIFCDLEPAQRKLYDELREHYRVALLAKIESVGLNRSKIMVLEALLRLRQAACHPGLLDKEQSGEPSAKLDTLMEHVTEIWEEGHKTLVFSQFTSMLAIVRDRLDKEGIPYEYLDGKTRNRADKVERFQTDPDCKVFLISLKAGGVGLNLTAAEYVFVLDPWWNPAVEAQAIDRTHRIGQTKPVFAYRLIARDTVEEKVLELQKTKRDLADAILSADNNLIGTLKREDLELLLS